MPSTVAGVVGGDQRRVRDVGAGQRPDQADLPQQAVDAGGVGAGAGHPQHHALAAALDQVQGVLRTALELFEHRLFAGAGRAVRVQPASKNARVQSGFADTRHCTPRSLWRE